MSREQSTPAAEIDSGPAPRLRGDGPVSCWKGDTVRIVGASVRAAAHSALRAGLSPIAFDLYADEDLLAACPTTRLGSWDEVEAALEPTGLPWMYTGPLENEPELLERLSSRGPLWGNSAEVVRAVRDPQGVHTVLREAGLPVAEVRTHSGGLQRDGSWLWKRLRSSGGLGVRAWDGSASIPDEPHFYQRRLTGPTVSGCFWAQGTVDSLACLGFSQQLVGRKGFPFGYVGSIGPIPVPSSLAHAAIAQARVLTAHFGLRGLFGIDFVVDSGEPILVEVNPRYTASVEVLELASGGSLLGLHARAFQTSSDCAKGRVPGWSKLASAGRLVGKRIVYAERSCRFEGAMSSIHLRRIPGQDHYLRPSVADLPAPGTQFEAGWPVLTVFASGRDVATVELRMEAKAAALECHLVDP